MISNDDYFLTVGSKPTVTSGETPAEGAPEHLLDVYRSRKNPIEANLTRVDNLYSKWTHLLFNSGYTIVAQGPQSKLSLLETFKTKYLDSGQIPNETCSSSEIGRSFLDVMTVRLHGFTPVTFETFVQGLFEIDEFQRSKLDGIVKQFLDRVAKSRTHHVFLMHSIELLYKDCRKICDLIFKMRKQKPTFIHILMSSDHMSSGRILTQLRFPLLMIFDISSYGGSCFYERAHAISLMDCNDDQNMGNETTRQIFGGQIDVQSLKDIYQALQANCRQILIYILNDSLERNAMKKTKPNNEIDRDDDDDEGDRNRNNDNISDDGSNDRDTRRGRNRREVKMEASNETDLGLARRRTLRRSTVIQSSAKRFVEQLTFTQLMDYCTREFLVRRSAILRDHLNELIDHRIIEMDESGNKIECLVSDGTTRKFLDYVKMKEQQQ